MDPAVVDEEWALVASLLPEGWEDLARETKALRRARGIDGAATLLRLILLHAGVGLSLRSTVARARVVGLAAISDVALHLRLRDCGPWLEELTSSMLKRSRYALSVPVLPAGMRLRAVDATTVQEPGATGTSWRVHYTLALPELRCDFFEVTGVDGGETYRRIPVRKGDVILGDRGYCQREGVRHVIEAGGAAIVRLNLNNFPLLDRQGRKFGLLSHLRQLTDHQPREWTVQFDAGADRYEAQLCAVRRSAVAAERARSRILRRASRNGHVVQPETLEGAGYIFVLSTLSSQEASAVAVLDLYRVRWQIELAFKRMKSLLNAGHVPKYSDRSARAWIQGKLLTVLLIEQLLDEARLFSPWGFALPMPQSLA